MLHGEVFEPPEVRLEVSTETWSLWIGDVMFAVPIDAASAVPPQFVLALRLLGDRADAIAVVGAAEAATWAVLTPTSGRWPRDVFLGATFQARDPAGRPVRLPLRMRTPPYAHEAAGWSVCVDAVMEVFPDRSRMRWSITDTWIGVRDVPPPRQPDAAMQAALAAIERAEDVALRQPSAGPELLAFVRSTAPAADPASLPPRCPVAGLYVHPMAPWGHATAAIDALVDVGFASVGVLR